MPTEYFFSRGLQRSSHISANDINRVLILIKLYVQLYLLVNFLEFKGFPETVLWLGHFYISADPKHAEDTSCNFSFI